ncbi:SRPBCC family protein [Streptomyces canus]|uniref:SRPBCC family protein n=1 Tax=Streptomyces canus TaxID=58343 RepID=UPI002E257896
MPAERTHRTQYEVEINAPAGVVSGLIADSAHQSRYSPSTVHVEQLEFDGSHERLRIWGLVDGEVRSWITRRHFSADLRRVESVHQAPAAPTAGTTESWDMKALSPDRTRLTLRRETCLADDARTPAPRHTTDAEVRHELEGVRALAERWDDLEELLLTFEDSVRVKGPAELVYDFLYRVGDWPELLPHVSRVNVVEDQPGVQMVSMDTIVEGRTRTTGAVRVCFPHAGRIVFTRTTPTELLSAHTGEWSLVPDVHGVTVLAQHSVVLREENIRRVLGKGVDTAGARRYVREAIGRTSTATLNLARRHAETAIRVL